MFHFKKIVTNSKPKSEMREKLCKGPVQNRFIQKDQKISGIYMSLKLLLKDQGFGIRDEKIVIHEINMQDPQCSNK
jgi:hypothetical protein